MIYISLSSLRPIHKKKALRVRSKIGPHCYFCGCVTVKIKTNGGSRRLWPKSRYTRDHLIPKSLGGTFTVSACHACNNSKADLLPHIWKKKLGWQSFWGEVRPLLTMGDKCQNLSSELVK